MNVVCMRIRLGRVAAVAAGAFIVALVPLTAAQAAAPIHFTETRMLVCHLPLPLAVGIRAIHGLGIGLSH